MALGGWELLDRKSSFHLVLVTSVLLRKYLQARSRFPYLVMRGLLLHHLSGAL